MAGLLTGCGTEYESFWRTFESYYLAAHPFESLYFDSETQSRGCFSELSQTIVLEKDLVCFRVTMPCMHALPLVLSSTMRRPSTRVVGQTKRGAVYLNLATQLYLLHPNAAGRQQSPWRRQCCHWHDRISQPFRDRPEADKLTWQKFKNENGRNAYVYYRLQM